MYIPQIHSKIFWTWGKEMGLNDNFTGLRPPKTLTLLHSV